MARPPARNTFLAHTLLRAVCPPPPWAEIIGLSWYDPDTGQASPPDFPEAPGGGHNIHLDILDVTTAPVTVHHIGLDDAERAALALAHHNGTDVDDTLAHQLRLGLDAIITADDLDATICTLILHHAIKDQR